MIEEKTAAETKRAREDMFLSREQKEYFDKNPGIVELLNKIEDNEDVRVFRLHYTWDANWNVYDALVARAAQSLLNNNTVKVLSIDVRSPGSLKELSEYLKHTQTLETLILDFAHSSDVEESYAALKLALEKNQSIKKLKICNFLVNERGGRRGSSRWGSTGGEVFIPSCAGCCVMILCLPVPNKVQGAVHGAFNKVRPSSWKKVAADRLLLAMRGILNNNKSLESLELYESDSAMDYRDIRRRVSRRFFKTLTLNTTLKSLCLTKLSLSKHSLRHLGRYLGKNTGLECIEIGNDTTAGYHGYHQFVKGLRKNNGLKSLTIWNSGIDNDQLGRFLTALNNKQNLTELSFLRCHIGDEGAIRLANWIEKETGSKAKKPQLKTLGLTNYFYTLTMTGIRWIANTVRASDSITTLSLGEGTLKKELSDEYIKEMSDLLGNHKALTDVTLYGPDITEHGLPALIAAMQKNQSITKLDLSSCRIPATEMVDRFAAALEDINFTLTQCKLGYNMGDDHTQYIEKNHPRLEAILNRNAMLPLPITLAAYMKDFRSNIGTHLTQFPRVVTDIIADYVDAFGVEPGIVSGQRKEDVKLQKELLTWIYSQEKPISWERNREEIIGVARGLVKGYRVWVSQQEDHKGDDEPEKPILNRIGDFFLGMMTG